MISVFHVITTIVRGGAENQLVVVAREQVAQGLDVHIVYLKGDPELEEEFISIGVTVHHELANKSPSIQPFYLARLISRQKVLIHAHLPRAELVALATLGRFKMISSRHNAEPFFPGAPKIISTLLSRLVELRTTRVIAISAAVKDYLLKSREISNPRRVEIVHYGYKPHPERTALGNNSILALHRLGTISRLSKQKDLPTMILAFQEFNRIEPGSSLSILGSGSLESELKIYVAGLALDSKINFLGRSAHTREFLLSLDAFILTSLYEGFGMVLLEAMDAQIPIVASRNSAILEVLGSDFPGLCTTSDHADFFKKITNLRDAGYRKKIIELQEQRLGMFSAKRMSEKLLTLYES